MVKECNLEVSIKAPKEWQREIEVELEPDRLKTRVASLLDEYKDRALIPGFRPGHVPRHILERRLGNALESAAVQELVEQVLAEVMENNGIKPAAQLRLDDLEVTQEKAIRLRIVVEVVPEFELKSYEKLRLVRREPQGFDAEFEKRLQELRVRCATFRPVNRPAQEHDFLVVDYKVVDTEGPVKPRSNVMIELGDRMNFPEVNQALLGTRAGDEVSVVVNFPGDYPDPELAGRSRTYRFLVRDVKERILPEVNEEFAEDLGYENLDALRRELNDEIIAERAQHIEDDLKNQVFDQLTGQYSFEPPASWVRFHLERLLRQANLPDDEEIAARLQPIAVKWARFDCIVSRIASRENLSVSDEEVTDRIRRLAEATDREPGELSPLANSTFYRNELLREKVLRHVIDRAEVVTEGENPSLQVESK
ncbi:MAG: trigger factor [candidate division WOR-3 bacterium]